MTDKVSNDYDKTVVIIQPCFFPWRGQFDLISKSDVTILLDTVQYVRHTWFNRNRIMSSNGPIWFSIPVKSTGNLATKIKDIKVSGHGNWQRKLLMTIKQSYARYPYINNYYSSLDDLINNDWIYLTDLTQKSLEWGFNCLNKQIKIIRASELGVDSTDPVERIIRLCKEVCANNYLSGPSAKNYIGEGKIFNQNGIQLDWMKYEYPIYPQVRKCDEPLSILDLLFNVGKDAPKYIWKT